MEEKMKVEKVCSAAAVVASASGSSSSSSANYSRSGSFGRPSWLLLNIADLEKKMKTMALNILEEDDSGADSFAERAENYYRRRPQLLNLLQDLYNDYLLLADRYCQSLAKNRNRQRLCSSYYSIPGTPCFDDGRQEDVEGNGGLDVDSDAESSISYQPPFATPVSRSRIGQDTVVSELVMKVVDYEILVDELSTMDGRLNESSRKIELQKSLLEVLESERMILLNENAKLEYRVTALMEENRGLASESLYMKRKAGELARCVLRMREDHRVLMLSRKIEDLQGQIHGLEKRNKDYSEQLVKQGSCENLDCRREDGKNGGGEETLEDCFYVNEKKEGGVVSSKNNAAGNMVKGGGGCKKVSKWWQRAKSLELFLCVPDFNSTRC